MTRTILAVLFTMAAVAGCGTGSGPAEAFAAIAPPAWFTTAQETAEEDADPPRWTWRYAKLPKSASDVEMVYAQTLDRAGWRFHAGDCVSAPRGGAIKADCWTRDDLVLGYQATPLTSGDENGPARLDVVIHEQAAPSQAILACPVEQCRVTPLPGLAPL